MKPVLRIYVAHHCTGCEEAQKTATTIMQDYPAVAVKVIDIANTDERIPDAVFATPTYMLNNRIVSLGNPAPEDIARWLAKEINSQPVTE